MSSTFLVIQYIGINMNWNCTLDAEEKSLVMDGIKEWGEMTCLKFIPGTGNEGNGISFVDSHG